jgi:uncharacterized membrane protein
MTAPAAPSIPRRHEERNVPPALQGLVSRFLRVGVLLSGALLLAAVVLEAATGHGSLLAFAAPSGGGGIGTFLEHGGAPALALLGVLVLIATPLSRVALSTALFAASGDRTFALITLFVLAILGVTIVVGVLR